MRWIDEVQTRVKRKNQVLFAKDSPFLQDLIFMMSQQDHRAMALWAFEFAEDAAEMLRARYPDERRLFEAIEISKAWAAGKVKMPIAQRAILNAHAVAKEIDSPEDIALCHAIGQACGVVHTAGHAIGFPIYELTALVRRYGLEACVRPIEEREQQYIDRLLFWQSHYMDHPTEWADFMLA